MALGVRQQESLFREIRTISSLKLVLPLRATSWTELKESQWAATERQMAVDPNQIVGR